jgi:hypothetical protein
VSDFILVQGDGFQVGSVILDQSGDCSRKAMQKITNGKYDAILDGGFDFDGYFVFKAGSKFEKWKAPNQVDIPRPPSPHAEIDGSTTEKIVLEPSNHRKRKQDDSLREQADQPSEGIRRPPPIESSVRSSTPSREGYHSSRYRDDYHRYHRYYDKHPDWRRSESYSRYQDRYVDHYHNDSQFNYRDSYGMVILKRSANSLWLSSQ